MTGQVKIPRLMISSFSSNSGKTLITCALLYLLKKKNLNLTAFKCGPDFIDPLFHSKVLGIKTFNTDIFLAGKEAGPSLFAKNFIESKADLALLEGAMGYYDGLAGTSPIASASEVAAAYKVPVILVVDASSSSFSLIPQIKGFLEYKNGDFIKGIILNKVSAGLYAKLKEVIEKECHLPVLAFLPKSQDLLWPSRHLGLFLPNQIAEFKNQIAKAAALLEESLDFEKLNEIANAAEDLNSDELDFCKKALSPFKKTKVKIALAYDQAFCFYYQDNISLLQELGAEIIYFSPLRDTSLPDDIQGVIFGGGYPELYAKELEENVQLRKDIKNQLETGLPALAECGGFMYLQEKLSCADGRSYSMCGFLKGQTFYTGHLVRFGYAEFSTKDYRLLGHEFHYFDSDCNGSVFKAQKPLSEKNWLCIQKEKNVVAGFPHFYYWSCPQFAFDFLTNAASYRKKL